MFYTKFKSVISDIDSCLLSLFRLETEASITLVFNHENVIVSNSKSIVFIPMQQNKTISHKDHHEKVRSNNQIEEPNGTSEAMALLQ